MSDYYCIHCGGRTSMMGHGDGHNPSLLNLAARVCDDLEVSRRDPRFSQIRRKVVDAIGQWQIAEIDIPGGSDWMARHREET